MGRDKRSLPSTVAGGPKERHRRHQRSQFDPHAPVPEGFVAKPALPKSKHHTYFEFVENKNKKKKLEFQITTKKDPPPGFAFVPIGNPQLTTACKEISRERDAMIFIVSNSREAEPTHLASQIHRMGHHIRETIVEEARATLSHFPVTSAPISNGEPEPIPDSQEEYCRQADDAIRDLFPRIPNTDRDMIIAHSFTRGASSKEEQPVGLCADIPLARRVQLAVLAHIRHVHTRYDDLLKETSWQNARKVVEALCLDTLVKWRGDEETGRDQLDEILREVVVISDSEAEDSDAESTDDTSVEEVAASPELANEPMLSRISYPVSVARVSRPALPVPEQRPLPLPMISTVPATGEPSTVLRRERNNQRGFKRYRAWEEAIRRHREREMQQTPKVMDPDPNGPAVYARSRMGQIMMPSSKSQKQGCVGARNIPVAETQYRDQDVPLPSIEPVSPQTMPPSFVRSLPPRIPLEHHSRQRPREDVYAAEARHEPEPGISSPYRRPLGAQYPHFGPNSPQQVDVFDRGHGLSSQSFHIAAHREVYREDNVSLASTSARRIIVDAPRPGTRSNPIIMEDRGGFYERVAAPQERQDAPFGLRTQTPSNTVQFEPSAHLSHFAASRGRGSGSQNNRSLLGLQNRYVGEQLSVYPESPPQGWEVQARARSPRHTQMYRMDNMTQPHVYNEYPQSREGVRRGGWEIEEARFTYQYTQTHEARPPPENERQSTTQSSRQTDGGDVIVLE